MCPHCANHETSFANVCTDPIQFSREWVLLTSGETAQLIRICKNCGTWWEVEEDCTRVPKYSGKKIQPILEMLNNKTDNH